MLVSWLAFNNPSLLERLLLCRPAILRSISTTVVTHGFVHADDQHLLFNMITLFLRTVYRNSSSAQYIGRDGFALFLLSALVVAILPTYLRHRRISAIGPRCLRRRIGRVIRLHPAAALVDDLRVLPAGSAIVYGVIYVGYSIWMDRQGHGQRQSQCAPWGAGYGVLFTLLVEPSVGPVFLARVLHPSLG